MMMEQRATAKRLNSERGFITVDFLFAMTMAAVMIMMMFVFSTTLTVIEISQYIAFATARAHAPAHKDQETQVRLARQKFESYQDSKRFPALAPLLKNGWFNIETRTLEIRGGGVPVPGAGGDTDFNDQYGYRKEAMPQTGIRFKLQADILKMNLPFLGRITEDSDFSTYVTGFLIREPTTEECRKQIEREGRFEAILDQDSRFRQIYHGGVPKSTQTAYFALEDNGC